MKSWMINFSSPVDVILVLSVILLMVFLFLEVSKPGCFGRIFKRLDRYFASDSK